LQENLTGPPSEKKKEKKKGTEKEKMKPTGPDNPGKREKEATIKKSPRRRREDFSL
jgi:hypothetical protein